MARLRLTLRTDFRPDEEFDRIEVYAYRVGRLRGSFVQIESLPDGDYRSGGELPDVRRLAKCKVVTFRVMLMQGAETVVRTRVLSVRMRNRDVTPLTIPMSRPR